MSTPGFSSLYDCSSLLDCTAYWSLTAKSRKKKFVKCVSSSFQIKSPYTSMALPVLGISAQVLIFGCPHAYFPIPEGPQLSKREPAY